MSDLRKITDLDENSLDDDARKQIKRLLAVGRKREHLVINSRNRVYVDIDLARELDLPDEPDETGDDEESARQ
jgi:hypothetical protein